jgi:inorganic pyrophosphatase
MDYLRLPIGDDYPDSFNLIVEIPKGSANKYEYNKKLQVFELDRTLYSPMHYPGDYGFVPSTLALDGDPLDAIVLTDEPTFTGCLLKVRAIGMLEMVDQGETDEKLLALPMDNPRYDGIVNYTEIHSHVLKELDHFFQIYKELELKRVETYGWRDAAAAKKSLMIAHSRFQAREQKS